MKVAFSHLLVAFLWLLHWLPLPILRALGWGLGRLLFVLARARRIVPPNHCYLRKNLRCKTE